MGPRANMDVIVADNDVASNNIGKWQQGEKGKGQGSDRGCCEKK